MEKKIISKNINSVFRVCNNTRTYILKHYEDNSCMQRELEILNLLFKNKLSVPRIMSVENNEIALEDLGELTLLEWLKREEKNSSITYHQMIIKLLGFFQEFYRATKDFYGKQYIINDVNISNFIITNNKIYGIDFEFCSEGNIEKDIGRLVAYIVTYKPVATDWKFKFVDDLIHIFILNFNIHTITLIKEIEVELNRISKRSNSSLPVSDIVCRIAEELI